MTADLMPAAFIGHGNPMNALEHNRYTEAWRAFGESVPRPAAMLAVSAHWYINATAVTAMARPRTIHDFYGFPQELFDVQYPAPGLRGDRPARSSRPSTRCGSGSTTTAGASTTAPGRCSVTCSRRPTSPCCSSPSTPCSPLEYHLDLGARLAPLREQGVLVVASGNVVHNLRLVDPAMGDRGTDAALRFDDEARRIMTSSPGGVLDLAHHPDFGYAVPTPDHFLPLLYLAGLAAAAGQPCRTLVDGYVWGSLSMIAYTLGRRRRGRAHARERRPRPVCPRPERGPPRTTPTSSASPVGVRGSRTMMRTWVPSSRLRA